MATATPSAWTGGRSAPSAPCAEDALRVIAKYLWQRQYPSIYADSRARRDDKTGPAAAASPVRPN
jgi:hypothetical protein